MAELQQLAFGAAILLFFLLYALVFLVLTLAPFSSPGFLTNNAVGNAGRTPHIEAYAHGLCTAFQEVKLRHPRLFHLRDFVFLLRYLRRCGSHNGRLGSNVSAAASEWDSYFFHVVSLTFVNVIRSSFCKLNTLWMAYAAILVALKPMKCCGFVLCMQKLLHAVVC